MVHPATKNGNGDGPVGSKWKQRKIVFQSLLFLQKFQKMEDAPGIESKW